MTGPDWAVPLPHQRRRDPGPALEGRNAAAGFGVHLAVRTVAVPDLNQAPLVWLTLAQDILAAVAAQDEVDLPAPSTT